MGERGLEVKQYQKLRKIDFACYEVKVGLQAELELQRGSVQIKGQLCRKSMKC